MSFYEHELKALKKKGRFRERQLVDSRMIDLASNDYLGLAHEKVLFEEASRYLYAYGIYGPKASMLVNGYHEIHRECEQLLCSLNGFEEGIVVGSGFCANIAMIEALCRKGDLLVIDERYHASGILATGLIDAELESFAHNDMDALEKVLKKSTHKRRIIAVEGIYSMDGDRVPKEVFELAAHYNALLIVDEAHSSGVIGNKLLGVYDYYDIKVEENHIKMGTFGKAYGSFGAYILASKHIVEFLINRAKPVIYATALSLIDTLIAHKSIVYIQQNLQVLKQAVTENQRCVQDVTNKAYDGLIVNIEASSNQKVLEIQKVLKQGGILVGAIRQPTVEKPIIRLIARLGVDKHHLFEALKQIKELSQ